MSVENYTEDEAVRLLLHTMSEVRLLEQFMKKLAARELSEECIDEILGTATFDRFEPTVSRPHGSRWVSSKTVGNMPLARGIYSTVMIQTGRLLQIRILVWLACLKPVPRRMSLSLS